MFSKKSLIKPFKFRSVYVEVKNKNGENMKVEISEQSRIKVPTFKILASVYEKQKSRKPVIAITEDVSENVS